jgi:hypothetical protein
MTAATVLVLDKGIVLHNLIENFKALGALDEYEFVVLRHLSAANVNAASPFQLLQVFLLHVVKPQPLAADAPIDLVSAEFNNFHSRTALWTLHARPALVAPLITRCLRVWTITLNNPLAK